MNSIDLVVNKYILNDALIPFILTTLVVIVIIIITIILVGKRVKEGIKK